MIIPPSAMLIIDSFVAEQSVGDMFLAGVVPGPLPSLANIGAIWALGRFTSGFVGGRPEDEYETMPCRVVAERTLPTLALVAIVLGGINTG